jgi:hypothetical protein
MRDAKENPGKAETWEKASQAAPQAGAAAAKQEFCNPSVCIGGQKPSHCICPTDKK